MKNRTNSLPMEQKASRLISLENVSGTKIILYILSQSTMFLEENYYQEYSIFLSSFRLCLIDCILPDFKNQMGVEFDSQDERQFVEMCSMLDPEGKGRIIYDHLESMLKEEEKSELEEAEEMFEDLDQHGAQQD